MSSAGSMPSHSTASAIVAKTMPVSHDLAISGYSVTKNCYLGGKYRKSAKFAGGGHRWYLRYYPNGCNPHTSGYVTFLLYHDDADNGAGQDELLPVEYKLSLLGLDGNPVRRYESKNKVFKGEPYIHQTQGLISTTALEQSPYLRDDAFRVRCEFRVPIIDSETVLPPSKPEEPTQSHVPVDVHERLLRVFSEEVPADVALEVGNETFRAHRRFLAAQSPVFAALFDGPMRETTAPSLRIDDMEPQVFKAMLDFIYKGNLQPPLVDVDEENNDAIAITQHLLVVADRYNLERLKSICAEKLCSHINTSTVATTLDLAHRHGCRALKDACYDFLAPPKGNLKAILNSEGFEQLVIDFPSIVVELLARVAPSPP